MKLFKGREGVGLSVLIVIIILVGGFFIIHHKSHKPAAVTVELFVDPTKTFDFKLPSNWKISVSQVTKAPPVGSDLSTETDLEDTSIRIPGAPILVGSVTNFIEVQLNETSNMSGLFCENIPTGCNPETLTINGNPALFQHVVNTTGNYETTDIFAINHGSKTVEGYFIESRSKSYTPVSATGKSSNTVLPVFNESGAYGAFRTLVNSIRFLN